MNGLRLELWSSLYTTPAVQVHGIFSKKKLRYQKDTQTTTQAQSSRPPSAFYVSTHRLISVALAAATTILGIKPRGRLFPRKRHDRAAVRDMSGDFVG
jgi:hypothetical protein